MNPDPTTYILAASLIGSLTGWLIATGQYNRKRGQDNRDSWAAARRYYSHLYSQKP
jgi:hypothetical protein